MAGCRGFVGEMEPVKLGPFPTFPKKEEGDSLFVAQGIGRNAQMISSNSLPKQENVKREEAAAGWPWYTNNPSSDQTCCRVENNFHATPMDISNSSSISTTASSLGNAATVSTLSQPSIASSGVLDASSFSLSNLTNQNLEAKPVLNTIIQPESHNTSSDSLPTSSDSLPTSSEALFTSSDSLPASSDIARVTSDPATDNFPCQKCRHIARSEEALKLHDEAEHDGPVYSCDACDFVAGTPGHLILHRALQHSESAGKTTAAAPEKLQRTTPPPPTPDSQMYSCHQCIFKAATPISLLEHIQLKHARGQQIIPKSVTQEEAPLEPAVESIEPEPVDFLKTEIDIEDAEELCSQEPLDKSIGGGKRKSKYSTYFLGYIDGQATYKCNLCDFTATKNATKMLKMHLEREHLGIVHRCESCDFTTHRKQALREHVESVHQGIRHPCEFCGYQAKTRNYLKVHKDSKHNGIRHKCPDCDFQAITRSQLNYHQKSVHSGIKHPCDRCDYVGSTEGALKNHKETHGPAVLLCDQCDFVAKHKKTLKFHKENVHDKIRYPCEECEFIGTSIASLKRHRVTEHGTTVFPCDLCDFSTKLEHNLRWHKIKVHDEKKFSCDQCVYVSATKATLNHHIKIKHMGLRFPCGMCEYSATDRGNLRKHQRNVHGRTTV